MLMRFVTFGTCGAPADVQLAPRAADSDDHASCAGDDHASCAGSDDGICDNRTRVPKPARPPPPPPRVPPVLRTCDVSGGTQSTIASSRIDVRLLPAPPFGDDWMREPDAVGIFTVQTAAGEEAFRLTYQRQREWPLPNVEQIAWRLRGHGHRPAMTFVSDTPWQADACLGIFVDPAQEPCLRAENITGLSLTPPEPFASDWHVVFFGQSQAAPHVYATCGSQGPEACLALDNTDVLWTKEHRRHAFAFNEVMRGYVRTMPAQSSRTAPADALEDILAYQ